MLSYIILRSYLRNIYLDDSPQVSSNQQRTNEYQSLLYRMNMLPGKQDQAPDWEHGSGLGKPSWL